MSQKAEHDRKQDEVSKGDARQKQCKQPGYVHECHPALCFRERRRNETPQLVRGNRDGSRNGTNAGKHHIHPEDFTRAKHSQLSVQISDQPVINVLHKQKAVMRNRRNAARVTIIRRRSSSKCPIKWVSFYPFKKPSLS